MGAKRTSSLKDGRQNTARKRIARIGVTTTRGQTQGSKGDKKKESAPEVAIWMGCVAIKVRDDKNVKPHLGRDSHFLSCKERKSAPAGSARVKLFQRGEKSGRLGPRRKW